jgi:hypothetical protein
LDYVYKSFRDDVFSKNLLSYVAYLDPSSIYWIFLKKLLLLGITDTEERKKLLVDLEKSLKILKKQITASNLRD